LFLRFQSYGEAKPSGENFIDCELLAKVKTPAFSNEFISSMLGARCKTAAAQGFRVRRRAHAEHLFYKIDWPQVPAAVWRSLVANLDLATQLTYVPVNTVESGPLWRGR